MMDPQVNIGDRPVGPGFEPFVVAEVGINHNGELDRALEMIHVAAKAGCDAVKFQTFKALEFVNDPSQMFAYRSQGQEVTESMLAMFQRYELPESAWPIIKTECERAGILFMSTPQNRSDLDILLKAGIPAIKIGSDDFTNLPLLKNYAESGLPLILSTGMSDLAEAYQALESVGALDGYPLILLVCTSQYPTLPENVNLARIATLRAAFPMVPIGYSDHSVGPLASSLATALGACFLEKHFTLSHDLPGPDHWFSEDSKGLSEWVIGIRTTWRMMGSPIVRPSLPEQSMKIEAQRRLVASRDIQAGEVIDAAALTTRRVANGRGLLPRHIELLVGRTLPRSFSKGEPIEL